MSGGPSSRTRLPRSSRDGRHRAQRTATGARPLQRGRERRRAARTESPGGVSGANRRIREADIQLYPGTCRFRNPSSVSGRVDQALLNSPHRPWVLVIGTPQIATISFFPSKICRARRDICAPRTGASVASESSSPRWVPSWHTTSPTSSSRLARARRTCTVWRSWRSSRTTDGAFPRTGLSSCPGPARDGATTSGGSSAFPARRRRCRGSISRVRSTAWNWSVSATAFVPMCCFTLRERKSGCSSSSWSRTGLHQKNDRAEFQSSRWRSRTRITPLPSRRAIWMPHRRP